MELSKRRVHPLLINISGAEHGAFFNHDDAVTMAAFTERLMPGAPDKPGANDTGVLNYIDLALAGAYLRSSGFLQTRTCSTRRVLPQDS